MSSSSSNNFAIDTTDEMLVKKRNGSYQTVSFDKILRRIKRIGKEVNIKINYTALAMKVIDQLYEGISTTKIDELTSEQCASMASIHPDYNILAGRIIVSNHLKNTANSFVQVMSDLYHFKDKRGQPSPLISDSLYQFVLLYGEEIESYILYDRDYLIDYFGFKTLERSYLMKIKGKTVERPQHMWMRVSIGIHGHGSASTAEDLTRIKETYDLMSEKYFTHATPTLFNAGTPRPQLSSCFLLAMEEDSIEGIYNTLKDCALISKMAGGIGLHIHNIRATGSHIRGTNGTSNGIVPMLRVFNNTAKYVDQCLTPDTILYTTHGPIQIRECVAGETEIIQSTGSSEIVQNVLEHFYSDEMLHITTEKGGPLKITKQHPILLYKHEKYVWTDAEDVFIGDKIVSVIPTYEKDVNIINALDCHVFGILFTFCEKTIYEIKIPFQSENERAIEIILAFFDHYSINYSINDEDNYKILQWKPSTVCPIRENDIFVICDGNIKKRIAHRWLNLPKYKLIELKKYLPTENLYLNLRLCEGVKIPVGTSFAFDTESSELDTILSEDVYVTYSTIQNIETFQYTGILYDLQMQHQHDYLLECGLVHNGGGKRNGSFAIYLEPWHADIEMFLQMRKNHGDEELKARDLFYALWIPDLFMERVKSNAKWTLMCPDECPGLADVYGDEFVALYESYEKEGRGHSIQARDLWFKILDAQMETGTPYLCYKDAVNKKTNQKNLGTIKSSNLCSEIEQYSDKNETAVCNLASIGLPTFIRTTKDNIHYFDYEKLYEVTKVVTRNLNRVIDINYYPTEKTRRSNMRHRPIGIGVQGLADLFMILGLSFYCDEAKQINRRIFETIYYAALEQSCELAIEEGKYETFDGSPASQGILQFDMWDVKPDVSTLDWTALKKRIITHGLRNSLLLAPMPTASTSQILGFNECIEPITSNIYSRRTNAGEFVIANKYMMNDLIKLDLWNERIKNHIIANNGSIQTLDMLPQEIRDKYKTVWEIPMRNLIDMAADRGAFICQSQSLNLWQEDPTYSSLTSMHFYAWQKGLKTGMYYLRRRAKHQAQQFTIEPEKTQHNIGVEEEEYVCEMCSS